MKVKALRDILQTLTSGGVRQLDELLANVDDAELPELVAAIKPAITKLAASISRKKQAAKDFKSAIAQLATELAQSKHDNVAFEAVVDRIRKLKSVKLAEASEIASRFLGENKIFKSKPEALKAILKRQIADKRSADRQATTSGIF